MDFPECVVTIIPPTAVTNVSVPVSVQGVTLTDPPEAGVVLRARITVVTGARVLHVRTPSFHALLIRARIPVITVLGRFAIETACLLFIRKAIAVIVEFIGTDLVIIRGLQDPGMDHLVLVVAVRSPTDVANVSIQVLIDRIPPVLAEFLITFIDGAWILIIAFHRIRARGLVLPGPSRREVCRVAVSIPSVAVHDEEHGHHEAQQTHEVLHGKTPSFLVVSDLRPGKNP
jgi:hypothetical protein